VSSQYAGFYSFSYFNVSVSVSNFRDYSVGVHIPVGQMLEVQAPNVQNIVVIQPIKIMLEPQQTRIVQVKALCAAEKRQPPNGHLAKLTPFVLDAPANIFGSQQNIWNYMQREPRENRKWKPFTKTIRLPNGKRLYIEEKDNGIGPYNAQSTKTKFIRAMLNMTGFPVSFQNCASQHDVDYGTLGVTKAEADRKLKECAENVFNGTVGDFCYAQGIGLEQLCRAIGYYKYDISSSNSFADIVLATMAGGEESWNDGQKMARLTEQYREEIETALGMSIDTSRYYFVLKD
jgi:hypothetical protein